MQKIAIAFSILLLLLFGCTDQKKQGENQNTFVLRPEKDVLVADGINETKKTNELKPQGVTSFFVSTEKSFYYSLEKINITVNISADLDMKNVTILVYGIENTREVLLLNTNKNTDLHAGNNLADFDYRLPSCSYCSGMPPGNYSIYTEIWKDNATLATSNCSFYFSVGPQS
jgi:hypothetical protein